MGRTEIIEHTADVGLGIWGKNLEELFRLGAEGMFSLIADLSQVEAKEREKVELEAGSVGELFHDWLDELLYLFDTRHILFRNYEFEKLDEKHLRAIATGEKVNFDKHDLHKEIKAVTRHNYRVEKGPGGWEAEVLFDI